MKIHTRAFDTREEAVAFIAGVELVNDSALQCHDPQQVESRWQVVCHDRDDTGEDEPCPVCEERARRGWSSKE